MARYFALLTTERDSGTDGTMSRYVPFVPVRKGRTAGRDGTHTYRCVPSVPLSLCGLLSFLRLGEPRPFDAVYFTDIEQSLVSCGMNGALVGFFRASCFFFGSASAVAYCR